MATVLHKYLRETSLNLFVEILQAKNWMFCSPEAERQEL